MLAELETSNDDLQTANADMSSFIRSTKISTVFLDADLRLRGFTPEARSLFRLLDEDISEVVMSLFDVTELRKRAVEADAQREQAQRHLAEIEELYDVSPQAMAMLGLDMTYLRANQRMADSFSGSVSDLIGLPLGSLSPKLRSTIGGFAKDVVENKRRIENMQLHRSVPLYGDEQRVWATDWYPVHHDSAIIGVGMNVRAITDKVQLRSELRRVMQELQHRVKNMLANVLALVSRASRDATVDRLVFDTLAQRIRALSQTHMLLTQSNWSSAQLFRILEPELTAVYGEDRVHLKGPEIVVNARAALSLGMAVHELVTNAAKYGSFSVPDGKVQLTWVRQDDGDSESYIVTWQERGGPPPQVNESRGFGIQLIESPIVGCLCGNVSFFGNRPRFRAFSKYRQIYLKRFQMTQSSTVSKPKVLYVEDEVIVALDVAEGLESDLGLDVFLAHNLASAQAACAAHAFEYALLDMNLGNGEHRLELGLALAQSGTTVVFASGYNRNEIAEIQTFTLIEKPFQLCDVRAAFAK